MKKIFFTPGPTELFPTVPAHLQSGIKEYIGSVSHRSEEFRYIYQDIIDGLTELLTIPKDYHIFIVGSGTEAMERTIQNCVEKYSIHFVNGSFSKRMFLIAQDLGKKASKIEAPIGQGFDFQKIRIPKCTELICFTQNETSSGVLVPEEDIAYIAKKYPDILISVDIVSSVPYVHVDYSLTDVVFFSVQKGFGLPAGMGVMIVSPRAIQKAEALQQKKVTIGSYHSFPKLLHYAKKQQTHETPPLLTMYLFGKVIKDMNRKGIATIRSEIEQKAALLYDFLDHQETLSAFVKEKRVRSKTVIVVDMQKAKNDVKKMLAEKGLLVGGGYGENKYTQIRIANFPAHTMRDVKRLIRELKSV